MAALTLFTRGCCRPARMLDVRGQSQGLEDKPTAPCTLCHPRPQQC